MRIISIETERGEVRVETRHVVKVNDIRANWMNSRLHIAVDEVVATTCSSSCYMNRVYCRWMNISGGMLIQIQPCEIDGVIISEVVADIVLV